MKSPTRLTWSVLVLGLISPLSVVLSRGVAADTPYKIVNSAQYPGSGGIDYVFADTPGRRIYVPRGGEVLVFDLDTLKSVGTIANTRARGATVDPKSHHGFSSSSPVTMWDSRTLATLKTIDVQGRPDGILFEPFSGRVYIFSHAAPHVTLIDPKDGSVAGTIDLGGAPEQAASDGAGRLYVDLEDKDAIAVVDVKALKLTGTYDISSVGKTPAGLALDAKNHVLFALCRKPAVAVILSADDGKIITSLPIGAGTDGGGFNANTMEAFSSNGDGTLTIIKESSPTSFAVTQTVTTKSRAKTSSLDSKTNRIVLITTEPMPAGAPPAETPAPAVPPVGGKKGGGGGPAMLDILVVGR